MTVPLNISRQSFDYLVNQRGEFASLAKDYSKWREAYITEVQKTISQIGGGATHMLDIGSGLGVIDALFANAFGTHCTLVDGEDGDGSVKKHAEPFCSRSAVEDFMSDNDVDHDRWMYVNPEQLNERDFPVFDLVISLRSWCFHYPPEQYLRFVQMHTIPGARIVLDVRKNKEWRKLLSQLWNEYEVLEEGTKFDRVMYVVKGRLQ